VNDPRVREGNKRQPDHAGQCRRQKNTTSAKVRPHELVLGRTPPPLEAERQPAIAGASGSWRMVGECQSRGLDERASTIRCAHLPHGDLLGHAAVCAQIAPPARAVAGAQEGR
jgi:hypothetical protein